MMKKKNPIYGDSLMVERNNSLFFCTPISLYAISMELFLLEHLSGSPDKPGGLSIQLCKSEKKEFYIRYSS